MQSPRVDVAVARVSLWRGRDVKVSATIRVQAASPEQAASYSQKIQIEVEPGSDGVVTDDKEAAKVAIVLKHYPVKTPVPLDEIANQSGVPRRKARIVFTLHEFLTICAADGHMVRRTDRSLCDRASPVRCHQCLPDRHAHHLAKLR